MAGGDRDSVVLSEQESFDVLHRVILPAAARSAVAQPRPVVVVVAGQPGAGKTQIADLIQAALDRRGGCVRVGRDLYKPVHRHYPGLLAADVRTAGALVRPDTVRWQAAVEAHVRVRGFDAVVESSLADPDDFRASSHAYRAAGHRIEVVAVATAEALSQQGITDRLLTDGGWYVSWENHDTCAKGMLSTLAVIEAEQLADHVTVVRRDATPLYINELTPERRWRHRTAAERAARKERLRPWSAPETAVFRRALARTDRRVHTELADEDLRLAVQRDSERAAAWSEPVRRIAQPIAAPPGVAYHRLSAAEHNWIFDELITPTVLAGVVPRDDPRAVYVIGQPGASKTETTRMVRRVMRPGTTRLTGDDFKAAHPDCRQLLQQDPRGAGAAVRADYKAWFARAEALVRDRRGDLLIEAAPASAHDVLDSALASFEAGYLVELVVLAVREADSRLATALRYARALQAGIPARFTTVAGHNHCFSAVADLVAAAESHPAIRAITVIRRDGHALLRQEQPAGSGRAARTVAAERGRLYTEQEAAQFIRLYQGLRRALPQHRAELEDILALACPLMPAHWQPSRIGEPRHPVRLLPVPRTGYDSSFLSRLLHGVGAGRFVHHGAGPGRWSGGQPPQPCLSAGLFRWSLADEVVEVFEVLLKPGGIRQAVLRASGPFHRHQRLQPFPHRDHRSAQVAADGLDPDHAMGDEGAQVVVVPGQFAHQILLLLGQAGQPEGQVVCREFPVYECPRLCHLYAGVLAEQVHHHWQRIGVLGEPHLPQ